MGKHTFTSGTEYECFMATYCESCRRYIDWNESFEGDDTNPKLPDSCPIERAMAEVRLDLERFPDNFVKPDDDGHMECTAYLKGTHPALQPETAPIADIWRFGVSL